MPDRSCLSKMFVLTCASFAFVEYEDSRDAEDAFHDMHNRRVGRDTFIVEVCCFLLPIFSSSGHEI